MSGAWDAWAADAMQRIEGGRACAEPLPRRLRALRQVMPWISEESWREMQKLSGPNGGWWLQVRAAALLPEDSYLGCDAPGADEHASPS